MQGFRKSKGVGFAPSRSASQATTKRGDDSMRCGEQALDDDSGQLNQPSGRIMHVAGAELPYVAVLNAPAGDSTEHGFGTMREAEAFIKRNSPMRTGGTLSPLYDRPAGG